MPFRGLNRKIHLTPGLSAPLGFAAMPAGAASFSIPVPGYDGLRGLNVFVQAGVVSGISPMHVTNSGQLTVY